MPGSTAQTNKFHTFYLQQRPDNGDTWADIKVNHPLDYESIKEYNLTIRVEVSLLKMNYILNSFCVAFFSTFRPCYIILLMREAYLYTRESFSGNFIEFRTILKIVLHATIDIY